MPQARSSQSEVVSRGRSSRAGKFAFSLGCGILLLAAVALAGLAVVILVFRDPLPRLTPERVRAALKLWEAQQPRHYRAEITVRGQRPSDIKIEVRDGLPIAFTLNGVTPKNPETANFWTLDNLLQVVDDEFDAAQDPQKRSRQFNISRDSRIDIRGEFDPTFGYPRRYRRVVADANLELDWTVTKFEVVGAP